MLQIDSDLAPGEPPAPRHWSTDEAWSALVDFVTTPDHDVRATPEGLVVTSLEDDEVVTYRLGREEWAAYLNRHEDMLRGGPDSEVVPALVPRHGALPSWVTLHLWELAATRSTVLLRGGRLTGER